MAFKLCKLPKWFTKLVTSSRFQSSDIVPSGGIPGVNVKGISENGEHTFKGFKQISFVEFLFILPRGTLTLRVTFKSMLYDAGRTATYHLDQACGKTCKTHKAVSIPPSCRPPAPRYYVIIQSPRAIRTSFLVLPSSWQVIPLHQRCVPIIIIWYFRNVLSFWEIGFVTFQV